MPVNLLEREHDEQVVTRRFRIMTNGQDYRVEKLQMVGMLWWRREEWRPLPLTECPLLRTAVTDMAEAIATERARLRGWQPVTEQEIQRLSGRISHLPATPRL